MLGCILSRSVPIFMVTLLLGVLAIASGGSCTAAEDGLIGYWPLDEGQGSIAHDNSGYGNDGMIDACTWTLGYCGRALEITGTGMVWGIPSTFDDPIQEGLTMAAWVKWYGTSGTGHDSIVFDARDGVHGFVLCIREVSGLLLFGLWSPSGLRYLDSQMAVPINQWTHVAAVYYAATHTITLYLNGQEDRSGPGTDRYYSSHHEAAIGNNHWAPGDGQWAPLNGIVDEVRIYDRVLGPQEIALLLDCGTPVPVTRSSWGSIKALYR